MKFDEFKKLYIEKKEEPKQKRKHPEEDMQTACVNYFRLVYPRYVIFAVGNGGSRNAIEAKHMKKSGVLAGVSDLILIADHAVLFVEMKTKTGIQSERQKKFQVDVERLGFEYKICRSLQDFQRTVERWIKETQSYERNENAQRS